MGKQGPCYHCGITSTPLWRNGPPEKPVLCNACGSRWRTKGTLTNYTPLHAREHIDIKELRVPKVQPNEQKLLKRKWTSSNIEVEEEHEMASSDQNFHRVFEEDTSNRSSSGSAISYSESCSHFGGMDTSDPAGSVQCNFLDSLVPSRKRTWVNRPKQSPVEKLTRDLYSILHEESSKFSQSPEEDLLYETETPIGSVEIGNGGVLIRQPNTLVLEEESEASSLPIDNKSSAAKEAYSGYLSVPVDIVSKEPNSAILGGEKVKRPLVTQDHVKRDKVSYEKSHILRSRDSPLSYVDLTEVINFEGFMRYLTHEERQQLMKYLPSVDTARSPESLTSMFHSPHFVENISFFKQLLVRGIFDSSCSEMNADECRTLKKLVLGSLAKTKWVEHHTKLQDIKNREVVDRKGVGTGANYFGSSSSQPMRRPHDKQNLNVPEKKVMIKSPKRSCKVGITNLCSLKSAQLNSGIPGTSSISETNEYMENDVSFFSPRSFFASPPDGNSILNSSQFNDEGSDQDLLLDVCSNAFPEAELLAETWKQNAGLNSLSAESGIESISNGPTSSSTSQQPKQWND